MKQETTNFFNKGLLMDLNPLTTPNNVLTNCLNGTFVTFNGNDVILQNDMGNGKIETAKLWPGYIPLGIKEYGGIIYVVSYNPFTKKGQVGSFPSPERDFDGSDYENNTVNIKSSNFFENSTLKTTSIKKYLNQDEIVKVGDLFEVCLIDNVGCTTDANGNIINIIDENNILTILNDLNDLNHITNINTGKKILNIKIAAIDSNNNITYLDLNEQEYVSSDESIQSDGTIHAGSILAKFLLPINKNIADLNDFQAYTFSRNCKLLVIAELESLDSFELNVKPISDTQYLYEFSAKIEPYDFWRWLEIKIDYKENEVVKDPISMYIKNIYNDDFNTSTGEFIDDVDIKPGITDPLYPTNAQTGLESNISFFGDKLSSDKVITWTLGVSEKNTIINYEIIPHMTYGPVDILKKTGRLNVNRYGDNYVELTKWKYKTVDEVLTIDWGIDYNSTTSKKLYRIDFKFLEVKYDNPFTLNINAGGVDGNGLPIYSEFTSSDYTTSINLGLTSLQKNRLYLCTINYYRIDTNTTNESSLNELSTAWSLWSSENRFVYTNNLMDQYYNQYSDFNTINPNNAIYIKPQTQIRRNSSDEIYTPQSLLSYSSSGSFISNAVKNSTLTIDINAKGISQHEIDFEIDFDNINLNISPVKFPSITNKISNGRTFEQLPSSLNNLTVNNTLRLNSITLLHQYNGSNTYTEREVNPNVLLDVNELICPNNIDEDSLFEFSKRYKIDLVEKSSFTSGKKLSTQTTPTYAYVLDKYYSIKNYPNIFGYNVPRNANGYPILTQAYTNSRVYFMSPGSLFSSSEFLPNETISIKTYVEFPPTNPIGGNKLIEWSEWSDVTNNSSDTHITRNDLPSISAFTSKRLQISGGHTIDTSPDYLVYWVTNSVCTFAGVNWCYPLIKTKDANIGYVFIHVPSSDHLTPISFNSVPSEELTNCLKDMFDDKYLFQSTLLNNNNNNLYIPDPNSWIYNTYTVNNTMTINPEGSVSDVKYYINSTLITNDNVLDCLTHNSQSITNINFNNINITSACSFESKDTTFSFNSCDFSRILNSTTDWISTVNNRLFMLDNDNLIDITDTLDGSGNVYNKDNYYVYSNNSYKTGSGLWAINDTSISNFRELVLNTPVSLTPLNNYRFGVGKIVTGYEGQNKHTMVEDITASKTGGRHYPKLTESPYNYNIYSKPISWD